MLDTEQDAEFKGSEPDDGGNAPRANEPGNGAATTECLIVRVSELGTS